MKHFEAGLAADLAQRLYRSFAMLNSLSVYLHWKFSTGIPQRRLRLVDLDVVLEARQHFTHQRAAEARAASARGPFATPRPTTGNTVRRAYRRWRNRKRTHG